MAGALKRASPEVAEENVLMRALRDMNMPKFVDEDVVLFLGLIKDLFPNLILKSVSHQNLKLKIIKNFEDKNYSVVDVQVQKVV